MDGNTMGQEVVRKLKSSNYSLLNLDDREKSRVLNAAQDQFTIRRATADLNVKRKGIGIDSKRDLDLSSILSATSTMKRVVSGNVGSFIFGSEANGGFRTPDMDYQELESHQDYSGNQSAFGILVPYPDEALIILSEQVALSKGNEYRSRVPVKRVTMEEYNESIDNTYKNPGYDVVWRIEDGNFDIATHANGFNSTRSLSAKRMGTNADGISGITSIDTIRINHLIPGKDYTIESYTMRYIKRPRRIKVDTLYPAGQVSCELHPMVHDEIVDIAVLMIIQSSIPEMQKYQIADKEVREDE